MSSAADAVEVNELFVPEGITITGAVTARKGVPIRVAGTLSLERDLLVEGEVIVEVGGVIEGEGAVKSGGLVVHGAVKVPLDINGVLDVHGTGVVESPNIEYVDISLNRGARIKGPMSPRAPSATVTQVDAPAAQLPRLVASHGDDRPRRSSLGGALGDLIGRETVEKPASPESLGNVAFAVDGAQDGASQPVAAAG